MPQEHIEHRKERDADRHGLGSDNRWKPPNGPAISALPAGLRSQITRTERTSGVSANQRHQ